LNFLFWGCRSLYKAPDISNWNIKNIRNMDGVFGECISLSYLPDLSKWDFNTYYIYNFYDNMINYVEKLESPLEIKIKKSKMGKAKINQIFEELEKDFRLTDFFSKCEIKYRIVIYEGNMNKIYTFVENTL